MRSDHGDADDAAGSGSTKATINSQRRPKCSVDRRGNVFLLQLLRVTCGL